MDGINVGIEELYDVEHIDTDNDIRKALLGQRDEAAVHVAGKILHFLSFGKIEGEEVGDELV